MPATMDFLLDQIGEAGPVSARRMFGEYCLYFDGRPIGLVCDDQLFLKPTDATRALQRHKDVAEGAPFPGARPHLLITADHWDDRAWLCQMVRNTALNLPPPKPPRPATSRKSATAAPGKTPVQGLPNLGPKSQAMLASVGITNVAQLRKRGAVAAYASVQAVHPRASLNLLWALEGALTDLPWQEVARQHRTSLLLALEQHQQAARVRP